MRPLLSISFVLFAQMLFAQGKPITYTNSSNAYYGKGTNAFMERKICEITLKPDSTFAFWSRPNVSCFTWQEYKGTWARDKDSLFFFDNYVVKENDSKASYQNDTGQFFKISFRTDKNSTFNHKDVKVVYMYDFDAHLEDAERVFLLQDDNILKIPFGDIPNFNQLASIRVECFLNNGARRDSYLTENQFLNVRKTFVPNIISVVLIEEPRRQVVYRTIRGIISNDRLIIQSTTKLPISLPDYYPDIEFEDSYNLEK